MEILERYLFAVGRWLPKKQKKDILAELESTILDTLESRFGLKDDYTDEEVSEVILEFGIPWKVAAGYTGLAERLIGPNLLPYYYMITAIVSGAVVLGLMVSFVVGLFRPDLIFKDFILSFLQILASSVISVATVIGFTTIIFTLLEKLLPGNKGKKASVYKGMTEISEISSNWKPRDLPEVPKGRQKISRWEPILGIIFSVIAIVIFNFFRDIIGIYYTPEWGSGWQFVPILSEEAVKAFLPLWNLVWGVSILFCAYQLVKGRWTLPMRLIDVLRSLLDVGVLSIMIKGPELIDMELLLSYSKPEVAEALRPIAEFFNYSIKTLLIVALVLTCLGILGKIVNVFRSNSYSIPIKTKKDEQ